MEICPFTFSQVNELFPKFEDAVDVYAQTGGVAQYVMFFRDYKTVKTATDRLFLDKDGRLFQEANNMLTQELRDVTTYVSILRAMSGGEKDSGQIASKANTDPRAVFSYLNKLIDLEIVEEIVNPLSRKKREKRYRICDNLFRFNYAFIEPNISIITALGGKARQYILNEKYNEFLGYVYEDIIRGKCYEFGLKKDLPFMPLHIAKWWGNVQNEGAWQESEVDLVAFDDHNIIIGECKYKNKMIGIKELAELRSKSVSISVGGRRVYYLLASKKGFTKELIEEKKIAKDLILIEKAAPI